MIINKRQIHLVAGAILLALFIVIFGAPVAHAFTGDRKEIPQTMLDFINNGIFDVFSKWLVPSDTNTFYNYMLHPPADSGIMVIINAMKGVGGFMVIIFALSNMFGALEKGSDPQESIYRCMIQIFANALLIVNSDLIMSILIDVGQWLVGLAISIPETSTPAITLENITGSNDGGFGWWVQSVAILFLPYFFSIGMVIQAYIMCWSLIIELGVRRALAPWAFADIYRNGLRSSGMRYLKKYLAVFVKIMVSILICYLGTVLSGLAVESFLAGDEVQVTTLKDVFLYIFVVIAANKTTLEAMKHTSEYAHDLIVGV